MEIEKDFLYINGRSRRTVIGRKKRTGRKSRKPRRRISITARLPFKRHRRSLRARVGAHARARARGLVRASGKIRCGKNTRGIRNALAIPPWCRHGISFAINATGAVRPNKFSGRAAIHCGIQIVICMPARTCRSARARVFTYSCEDDRASSESIMRVSRSPLIISRGAKRNY